MITKKNINISDDNFHEVKRVSRIKHIPSIIPCQWIEILNFLKKNFKFNSVFGPIKIRPEKYTNLKFFELNIQACYPY